MINVIACLGALAVGLVAGKLIIPALRKMKAGQSILEIGPKWHMTKQGTPTMGGFIFIIAVAVSVIACGWSQSLYVRSTHLFLLGFSVICGGIGFIDDYVKVMKKRNMGLTALQKLALQTAVAVAFIALMRYDGSLTPNVYIPFVNITIRLNWTVYMILAAIVIVGMLNAVNLTDGVDGLATGVTMPVALFFAITAWLWGNTSVSIFASALFGALAAFLVYNFHPAKVFMGDTGSLFLGGAVSAMAFALDMPLILAPVGIIYIAETLSDIIQVAYFKLTHGKRIFRMAPLHHHFEMGGWSEKKICAVFTAITILGCILAYIGVMGRYA